MKIFSKLEQTFSQTKIHLCTIVILNFLSYSQGIYAYNRQAGTGKYNLQLKSHGKIK